MANLVEISLHQKQRDVYLSDATEILFGGSAGPGKSFLLRAVAILWASRIPGLQVYLFRRTYPELWANHITGSGGLPELLGGWIQSGSVRFIQSTATFEFWNGSRIILRHCQYESDVYQYQGSEIHVLLIDELTLWPYSMYRFLRSRVRLGSLIVPEWASGIFPRIVSGANPGGVGHNWVKALFVDQGPWQKVRAKDDDGGMLRQFIPALLRDNPTLSENDPGYSKRLEGLGNPALVKAMLEGDWNIVAGGMLDDLWRAEVHVVEPFPIPAAWTIRRSFDWGSSKPFSVGWWAEADGVAKVRDRVYPKNTAFRVAEWYGWNGKPNEGLRMTAAEIGRGILEREKAARFANVRPGPADPSIFAVENGRSIADDMALVGVRWEEAENARVSGWQRVRARLQASLSCPMEEPGLFVFSTCRQSIRTVPVIPRDKRNADDVDTEAEDHQADEWRYYLMTPARESRRVTVRGY
jgi:hypothetical protein